MTNGPKHDRLNKIGNNRLPITAPILPVIMVMLTAMVLEQESNMDILNR